MGRNQWQGSYRVVGSGLGCRVVLFDCVNNQGVDGFLWFTNGATAYVPGGNTYLGLLLQHELLPGDVWSGTSASKSGSAGYWLSGTVSYALSDVAASGAWGNGVVDWAVEGGSGSGQDACVEVVERRYDSFRLDNAWLPLLSGFATGALLDFVVVLPICAVLRLVTGRGGAIPVMLRTGS